MALSTVQIANLALAKVGADATIESLTEDSAEANEVNRWIALARQQTLAGFAWGFATKRAALATHADDPSDDWAYRYVYPADCLSLRFIEHPISKTADPIPFSIEISGNTKSILTDSVDARAIYTTEIIDTFQYTPYFIDAFSSMLAAHIAFGLTGDKELAQGLFVFARSTMVFASSIDANEKQEDPAREAEHIRGRD